MPDSPENLSPAKTGAVKSNRQSKPSFDTFLQSLKVAVGKPPKASLREVRRLLNVGFTEKESAQVISQVADVIEGYEAADRWAISMALAEVSGRARKFQHRLFTEVRSRFARKIGILELDLDGPGFKQKIEAWLLRSAPARETHSKLDQPAEMETSSGVAAESRQRDLPRDSWLRWAFVCLLSKPSAERRTEGILALIENWPDNGKKARTDRNAEAEFYRFLASVFGAEKPKSSRIAPFLTGLTTLRAQLTTSLNREQRLSRELAGTQEQARDLNEQAEAVRRDLAGARETLGQKEATIAALEQQLADAHDRYRSLDEHWKRSSSTNLAREIGNLSEEVGHEVQEAILSLDRETPNVAMALNRLRRLDAIIKRQTGHGEDVTH